ncbi:MAG: Na+/H+ antiporter subunit E [Hyphomicrobiales bacterium]|nr:Na+/H+ antiporter subunit E [Hyphomicrobiales bacterium]
MIHAISLGIFLSLFWLLLSGYFKALLLILGLISVGIAVVVALRMEVIDHEGHPVHLTLRGTWFWPWLTWEIIKANLDVAKVILDPKLPIQRLVFRVKAGQSDELGHVVYANAITLTPGTVSIDVNDGEITVHALTRGAAEGLANGEMDRRATALVDGPGALPKDRAGDRTGGTG